MNSVVPIRNVPIARMYTTNGSRLGVGGSVDMG